MTINAGRDRVWQMDAPTGAHKPCAIGQRTPGALNGQPGAGQVALATQRVVLVQVAG